MTSQRIAGCAVLAFVGGGQRRGGGAVRQQVWPLRDGLCLLHKAPRPSILPLRHCVHDCKQSRGALWGHRQVLTPSRRRSGDPLDLHVPPLRQVCNRGATAPVLPFPGCRTASVGGCGPACGAQPWRCWQHACWHARSRPALPHLPSRRRPLWPPHGLIRWASCTRGSRRGPHCHLMCCQPRLGAPATAAGPRSPPPAW